LSITINYILNSGMNTQAGVQLGSFIMVMYYESEYLTPNNAASAMVALKMEKSRRRRLHLGFPRGVCFENNNNSIYNAMRESECGSLI
jgi:hypothetical protein